MVGGSVLGWTGPQDECSILGWWSFSFRGDPQSCSLMSVCCATYEMKRLPQGAGIPVPVWSMKSLQQKAGPPNAMANITQETTAKP